MPLQKYNRFCLLVVEATYSSVISAPVMTTNRKLALKNALQEKWFQISKESLLLANEYGKKFFCRLPKLPSNSESEKNFKKQNLTVNLISEVASAAFYVKNCVSRVCFHLFLWNMKYLTPWTSKALNIFTGDILELWLVDIWSMFWTRSPSVSWRW